MRRTIRRFLAILASLGAPLAAIGSAPAQEPLFLRIRPTGETPRDLGGGSADESARIARARSEAIWERADRRARIAIASVCQVCLTEADPTRAPPAPSLPVPPRPETGRTSTAAAEPAAIPDSALAQTGAP